jgi:hypothetical protein
LTAAGNQRPAARAAIVVLLVCCAVACAPDLHETVGPLVPLPNVTGRVLRDGEPIVNIKVRIEDSVADSTFADTYTDDTGGFAFAQIGPGAWDLRVDSREPGDFAQVSYPFVFFSDDTVLTAPDLDVSASAFDVGQPADGASLPVPSLFDPVTFEWTWDSVESVTFQVRVYDAKGTPFWFSVKTYGTQLIWNGLGNMGDYEGRPAETGAYRWRLQLESGSGLEFDTGFRALGFQ